MTKTATSSQEQIEGDASLGVRPPTTENFSELFRSEFGYVWNSLRRLGIAASDLEDVTHDVFVTVYKNLEKYDPSRPLRPWLFGFAFRIASDHRRLARHRREVLDDTRLEVGDEAPLPEEQVGRFEEQQLVTRALGALEPDRRAVFVMHDIDGCPMPEIAASLGIVVNTAYSRLRLARQDFKQAIGRLNLSARRP